MVSYASQNDAVAAGDFPRSHNFHKEMTNPPLSVSKRSLRTKNIYGCFIFVIMFLGKALVVDILSKICKINVISALESVARQRVH